LHRNTFSDAGVRYVGSDGDIHTQLPSTKPPGTSVTAGGIGAFSNLIWIRTAAVEAFAALVESRNVEHASRTSDEGFRRDRQEVKFWFPHRHPVESVQCIR
jgi:hypothetical protein